MLHRDGASEEGKESTGTTNIRFFYEKESLDDQLLAACGKGDVAEMYKLIEAKASPNVRDSSGLTPLLGSARRGNVDGVRHLLLAKAFPSLPGTRSGRTPLHAAVLSTVNAPQCVRALIDWQADLEAKDGNGRTPLITAARRGKTACVRLLLGSRALVNAKDSKNGRTPLGWASRNDRPKSASILINASADLNLADNGGKTPLIASAHPGKGVCIKLLIDAEADLNRVDQQGRSALINATGHGRGPCVRRLLIASADANLIDNCGHSALYYALGKGFPEITHFLDRCGASLEGKDRICKRSSEAGSESENEGKMRGKSCAANKRHPFALLLACHQGNDRAVSEILRISRDEMIQVKDGKAVTPLHVASSKGHASIVKALLEAKFDPCTPNKAGLTPIHLASQKGHLLTLRLLISHSSSSHKPAPSIISQEKKMKTGSEKLEETEIQKKIDGNPADRGGRSWGLLDVSTPIGSTPLHYAAQYGHADAARILLDAKADMAKINQYGWRAIHYATSYGSQQVLRLLLKRKANSEARTLSRGQGDTPLIIAADNSCVECVRILLDAKAAIDGVNEARSSALLHAAFCGARDCVDLLISRRANINLRDSEGCTSLMQAALCGKEGCARLLVAARADVKRLDKEGNSALSFAREEGIVRLLIVAGAPLPHRWGFMQSPLGTNLHSQKMQRLVTFGKADAKRFKVVRPKIGDKIQEHLKDFGGFPRALQMLVIQYWDVDWHYYMGFETGESFNSV
ncbi:hypothetical protein AAMO2058_000837200 [Amorphochlora amoebiformis]